MALTAHAVLRSAIYATLLALAVYFATKYTLLYYEQPTTTLVRMDKGPDWRQLLVCTNHWAGGGEPLPEDALAYLTGYLVNSEFASTGPKEAPFRKIALNNHTLLRGRSGFNARFENSSGGDVVAALSSVRYLRLTRHGVKSTRLPVQFHFMASKSVCGYVPSAIGKPMSDYLLHCENRGGIISDNPDFWFITRKYSMFSRGSEVTNQVSLFSLSQFPFLRYSKHFIAYTYEVDGDGQGTSEGPKVEAVGGSAEGPDTAGGLSETTAIGTGPGQERGAAAAAATIEIDLHVDVQMHTYIQTRRSKCTPPEEGSRYPVGFLGRICTIECQEEAFNRVFGCSTFGYFGYEGMASAGKGLPPCHMYDYALPGKVPPYASPDVFANESAVLAAMQACTARRACQQQRFCREYEVSLRSAALSRGLSEPAKGLLNTSTEELNRVSILFPEQMTVVEEQLQIDTEGWVGTTGGIVGIYMGWSLMTGIDIMMKFVASKRAKSATEGQLR